MSTVYYGGLITPGTLTEYIALPHALLSVSGSTGEIEWIEEDVPENMLQNVLAKHGMLSGFDLLALKLGEFLMPGFIDTHTVRVSELHWRKHTDTSATSPRRTIACSTGAEYWQVQISGFFTVASLADQGRSGQQHELLDWLSEVTFPMESRFANIDFAREAYQSVVRRIIDYGVRGSPISSWRYNRMEIFSCVCKSKISDHDMLLLRYASSRSYQSTSRDFARSR